MLPVLSSPESVHIGVVGLGYVGLPLALEFGKRWPTVGFDINRQRVAELQQQHDQTREIEPEAFALSPHITFAN